MKFFLLPLPNVLGLAEEALDLVGLVEAGHQLRLQVVFHIVDEKMHNRLGHTVLQNIR